MQINTKIRYGLRTMVELTLERNKEGIFQKNIAKNQQLSEKYLDNIISTLKAAGLIKNLGGKKSGYILGKPSSEITVFDIYKAFESTSIIHCLPNPSACERFKDCAAREYWNGLNDVINQYLKDKTLEEITKRFEELNPDEHDAGLHQPKK
jgi:Rrf2 family transcriptional regulator, iron-sulfur cluster assembly transcription factor